MGSKITSIAKNTSYFTLALIVQKVLSFTYFTLLARYLVPAELGRYYLAISITSMFAIFIDLGLSSVLQREVARMRDRAGDFLSAILTWKIPLALLTMSVVAILANLMGYPILTKHLVYISSITMILDSFSLTLFAAARGHHNLKYESVSAVLFQLIVIALGLGALRAGVGLEALIAILVIASGAKLLYALYVVLVKLKVKIKPIFDKNLAKMLFLMALPFAGFGILQRFYQYFDTVLLSKLAGDAYVGYYQISFKIINALQFLPMAFVASLYPAFAAYWAKNRGQMAVTFERAMNYLIIISIPISVGIILVADRVIMIFKPEYLSAVVPLQIVMCALVFMFTAYPVGALLNATDRQKINMINMGIVLLASVSLNFFFIQYFQYNYRNGAIGASITVVITHILHLLLGLIFVPRLIAVRPLKMLGVLLKVLASVTIMGAFVLYYKETLNLLLLIPAAGLIYGVLLLVTGAIKKEDVLSVAASLRARGDRGHGEDKGE